MSASGLALNSGRRVGSKKTSGYWTINVRTPWGRKHLQVHRVIWELAYGPIPDGMEIDHIDRNPSNNRLSNLRLVTHSENNQNKGQMSTNTTGERHISKVKGRELYCIKKVANGERVVRYAKTIAEAVALRDSL